MSIVLIRTVFVFAITLVVSMAIYVIVLIKHYHLILTFDKSIDWSFIVKSWNKGIVDIAPFTPARAGYVAKYSLKQYGLNYFGLTPPFRLCSKGLGSSFLKGRTAASVGFNSRFFNLSGRSVPLHRYYINKLFPNYVYKYSTIEINGVKHRVSSRSLAENHSNYVKYRLVSQARFDTFVSNSVRQNENGLLGFLRHQDLALANKLSFRDFSLYERNFLNYAN